MTAADRVIRGFLLSAVPDGATVLDVGCGTGWAALLIAREKPTCIVHGADGDAGVVRRANVQFQRLRRGDRAACYSCTAEGLVKQFGRGRYDIAVSVHSLHHYDRPFDALKNMRGVVRRGGRVLIAEFDPAYGERLDDCPRFSLDKIVWLCEDAGLRVLADDVKRPGVLLVTAEKS